MKRKKIIAITLAVAVCLCLIKCGRVDKAPDVDVNTNVQEEQIEKPQEEESIVIEEPVVIEEPQEIPQKITLQVPKEKTKVITNRVFYSLDIEEDEVKSNNDVVDNNKEEVVIRPIPPENPVIKDPIEEIKPEEPEIVPPVEEEKPIKPIVPDEPKEEDKEEIVKPEVPDVEEKPEEKPVEPVEPIEPEKPVVPEKTPMEKAVDLVNQLLKENVNLITNGLKPDVSIYGNTIEVHMDGSNLSKSYKDKLGNLDPKKKEQFEKAFTIPMTELNKILYNGVQSIDNINVKLMVIDNGSYSNNPSILNVLNGNVISGLYHN